MRHIATARDQVAVWHEAIAARGQGDEWLIEAALAPVEDLIDTGALYRNALAHWDNASPEERETGHEWYPAAREWLQNLSDHTNRNYDRSAAIMAALSPRQDWDTNLSTGAHFLINYNPAVNRQQWLRTDPRNPARQTGTGMSGLGENIVRAMRVHEAHPQNILAELGTGPKVNNFYRNFMGDDDAVTIDTHMARALNTQHGGLPAEAGPSLAPLSWQRGGQHVGYEAYADAVRKAAAERGISPSHLQATIWLKFKNDLDRAKEQQKHETWERHHPEKPYQEPRKVEPGPLKFPIPDYTKESDDPRLPEPHPTRGPGYLRPTGRRALGAFDQVAFWHEADCNPGDPGCTSAMGMSSPGTPYPETKPVSSTDFHSVPETPFPDETKFTTVPGGRDDSPNTKYLPDAGGTGMHELSPNPSGPSAVAPAPSAPSAAPSAGGGVPLVQNSNGTWTSSDPAWAHLIDRESGGRNIKQLPSTQDANSGGNEAFGIFQITPQTWSAHGGQGSVYDSTPQQQSQVAADILRGNPSGSDWGAGMTGREDASALAKGLPPKTGTVGSRGRWSDVIDAAYEAIGGV